MKKLILLSWSLAAISTAQATDDKVDWGKDVWPFIEKSCVDCHKAPYEDERGRMRKPKEDLRYDGKAFILKGGEHNDESPHLTPGDPEKSAMLQLVLLPLSDDDHMPPEDDDNTQLTEEQVKTLELWIKQGADFGDWVGATE